MATTKTPKNNAKFRLIFNPIVQQAMLAEAREQALPTPEFKEGSVGEKLLHAITNDVWRKLNQHDEKRAEIVDASMASKRGPASITTKSVTDESLGAIGKLYKDAVNFEDAYGVLLCLELTGKSWQIWLRRLVASAFESVKYGETVTA